MVTRDEFERAIQSINDELKARDIPIHVAVCAVSRSRFVRRLHSSS